MAPKDPVGGDGENAPVWRVGKIAADSVSPKRCGSSGSGFTLTELIVVIAIIVILLVLLFPSIASLRDKGLAAKCVSNLRGLGSAIRLSAADYNGRWLLLDATNGLGTWDKMLKDRGYMDSDNASFCPSCNPKYYAQYQTYGATWQGVAQAPDNQNIITYSPPSGMRTYYDIKLMAIENPSKYLLMSDSYTTRFNTQYHIVQGNTGMDEIHLRHNNRANVLFADGHVDALNTNGLRDIGWRMAFDKKGTLKFF